MELKQKKLFKKKRNSELDKLEKIKLLVMKSIKTKRNQIKAVLPKGKKKPKKSNNQTLKTCEELKSRISQALRSLCNKWIYVMA